MKKQEFKEKLKEELIQLDNKEVKEILKESKWMDNRRLFLKKKSNKEVASVEPEVPEILRIISKEREKQNELDAFGQGSMSDTEIEESVLRDDTESVREATESQLSYLLYLARMNNEFKLADYLHKGLVFSFEEASNMITELKKGNKILW